MFDIEENLKKLPDKPGVYIHKDRLGNVIYVGKAISLKKRVRQYFRAYRNTDPKVRAMVSYISEFEYITTGTEMEALILECNLIKKYMPRYNVLLRDDKTYPFIKVTTTEEFPRIMKTRKIDRKGDKYWTLYRCGSSGSDGGTFEHYICIKKMSNIKVCQRIKTVPELSYRAVSGHMQRRCGQGRIHAKNRFGNGVSKGQKQKDIRLPQRKNGIRIGKNGL